MSFGATPAVSATAITMQGSWGPVYGPLDLSVDAGGVTVLRCPPGSGRTSLLLTIAGRMRPTSGSVSVFGRSRPRDIFDSTALAGIADLDTLAESVTVADLITERLRWDSHWYRIIRRADEADLVRVCRPVFGDLPLPPLSGYVDALPELDNLLLRIALADLVRKPLLVVGTLDQVTDDEDRDLLTGRLLELGREQTVLTSSASDVTGPDVRQICVGTTPRVVPVD